MPSTINRANMIRHNAFREYYVTSEYRGFRKVRQSNLKEHGLTQVTFMNGDNYIKANGHFVEQALRQAFKAIDAYYIRNTEQRISTASY